MTDDNTALADAQGSPGDPALPGGSSAAVPAPRPGGDAPPAPASPSSGFRVRNRLARLASRTGPDRPMLEPLLGTLKGDRAEQAVVVRAFDVAEAAHAGQRRKSGDPYITHPLAVATILAELGMPSPVIVAALLHDVVEDTDWTLEQIRAEFGDEVASLVDGVTKLDKVTFGEAAQAETVRKMLTAMAKDVRVLVIKLADRLHNMRTLRYLRREKQERIARDTLEIFAPLAHRLGMNTLKWELEDLSFSTLYPKRYDEIVRLVAELAPSRDQYLADVREQLNAELKAAKIKATVTGRPKHYYSIYQKMIVKGRDLTDIYDLVGIRVLVESERDCYAALGQIHARWQPVPGRFKDFIAMPKFNLYQSLHTTVIGPGGKPVEVQIRTYDMHRRAEYGVAAHWRYKQNPLATGTPGSRPARPDENVETDLNWIPQLMEWQAETADPAEFLDRLRFDLGAREVYVFTPRGDVIALPQGATPVDFAYAVHTEVGHRCYGARVNGRLVSLESRLENGDTVDVLTTKQAGGPSRDWLQFVVSARARTKIRQWFTRERREEAIEEGRQAIARAMRGQKVPLQRLLTHDALTVLARDLRFADISALYAAVGDHRVSAQHVVERLVSAYGGEEGVAEDAAEAAIPTSDKPRAIRSDSGVVVRGSDGALMGDVLAKLARCCSPVPGDEVMGFVTRGSGVSVHRTDCVNARSLLAQKDRVLDVEWAPTKDSVFPITVQVLALDRPRLLADVTSVLSDLHLDIVSATVTTSRNRVAMSRFTFETSDPKHLGQVLRSLQAVDGVYDAHRVIGSAGTVDPAT